jgi:hypothetical protein
MSEHVEHDANCANASRGEPWPRAVAGLAVVAHISIALALWQAPKPRHDADSHHEGIALSMLLSQTSLLTVWLVIGYGPVVRRLGWALCGWSGIAYVLTTAELVDGDASFIFALHILVLGAAAAVLRLFRGTVIRPDTDRCNALQFSILELFAAALAISIAAALWIRIDAAGTFGPPGIRHTAIVLLAVSLPGSVFTLISIIGLRGNTSLSMQMILAGMALLLCLAFQTDPHWTWEGLFEIHAAHWFVVAATLWIFAMCGYRLARATTLQSAEH